jgi:predicted nucleic acid-binding protein
VKALSSQRSLFTSRGRLGDGEREAIALAFEIGADAVLIDERAGRRVAEEAGLKVIGTLGLLLEAKRAGHVTTIRAELDKLLETSFFLSPQLCYHVLRMAGEDVC